MMGGEGPRTVAILWSLTAIVFMFLVARLYTRLFLVRSVGADDHMYFWSWVFLFLHNLFIHIAADHGFGQDQATLSYEDGVAAHKWEQIGQTFIIVGMGMSKMSLAIFLLRIVVVRWHRWSIWATGGSLMFASCMSATLYWLQCLPAERIFDPRVEGRCIINPVPWAVLLGSFCIFVDFFFALFPWVFLKDLEMKRKKKLLVGGCLSFGIFAGICGIVRTISLKGLGSSNNSRDIVRLVVWSAAEMSVTLVCIAVPILIPLYLRITKGTSFNQRGSSGPTQNDEGNTSIELKRKQLAKLRHAHMTEPERSLATNEPFDGVGLSYLNDRNRSDEAILLTDDMGRLQKGIMVREEIIVSITSR